MKSFELRNRIREISAVTIVGLGVSGCSAASNETSLATYQCSDVETWTVQPGNTLDGLIISSGALTEAQHHQEDGALNEALTHVLVVNSMDPEEQFQVSTAADYDSLNPVIHPGDEINLPTRCERIED